MPGRLRKGTGFSDSAQGCCLHCCDTVCKVSPWTKLICYSMLFLVVMSFLIFFLGGFAASGTDNKDEKNICNGGKDENLVIVNGSAAIMSEGKDDPQIPVINKNAYVWWLSNTGIFCLIMILMSCICCCSYVLLFCGINLHWKLKLASYIGFVLVCITLALYILWLFYGNYLIGRFGTEAISESVCRGVVMYVVLMYLYLIALIVAFVSLCIWTIHDKADDSSKQARGSVKSQPKLPNTKVLKMMV